jgi:AraC-like DNA-binding protein
LKGSASPSLYLLSGIRVLLSCAKALSPQASPANPHIEHALIVSDIDPSILSKLPTCRGVISRLAYERALEAGIDLEPLVKESGATKQQITDDETRMVVRRQIRFLNLVAEALNDELLGFHLALTPDLRSLGIFYYVSASSETMGQSLSRTARFIGLEIDGLALKYSVGNECRFEFSYVGVTRSLDRHQILFLMTALIRACRHLTGVRVNPTSVRFVHYSSGHNPELAAFFGENVEFGASGDDVTFTRAANDLKVISADPYLNKYLVSSFEKALASRQTKGGSFRAAVENAIVPLLPHGRAHAAEVAQKLGLSQRTSARRLSSEGLSFSQVLEDLRSDLAKQYLLDDGLSVSRIAWLLGYQEVSAFTHAFKRWTGKTPREVRAHAHG